MAEQRYCEKCRKTMADVNFYQYKDGTKCELCKACLTLHINNFEPDTFLWLLEKFDVPYIPAEWNVLRDRAYAKDPYKMNGMSVFGKYLSKMKLKQWNKFGWADSEKLQQEAEEKAKAFGRPADIAKEQLEQMEEAFKNGEISEAQYLTYAETHAPEPVIEPTQPAPPPQDSAYPVGGEFEQVELVDIGAELTQEDKVYLAMKWGRLYKADEWVAMEKLYNEFMNSFDIQGAAREDTLKMICKTSLKMNQAIDCGDVDSYQKLSRVYDAMMKSAKFTEAQNKETKTDFVESVGEMVAYCEKHGGEIPEFKIDVPYDIVDKIIDDLKQWNKTLIYEDKSLADEIEQFLKKKEIQEEMKRDKEKAKEKGLDQVELTDEDYIKFKEAIEADKEQDAELYAGGGDEE
jgi:hypothetical protein